MSVPRKTYGWSGRLGAPPARQSDAERDCVAAGECRPPHHSRKDKRRWCRGKPGIEHQWAWRRLQDLPNASRPPQLSAEQRARLIERQGLGALSEIEVCEACHKRAGQTRLRCHCGALIPSGERGRYRERSCPACGYRPHWYPRHGQPRQLRPRCQCELVKGGTAKRPPS